LRGAHRDWDAERLRRELRVGNVTFAASDLDLKGFATDDMQRFMDVPEDVTVYISQQDLALDVAGFFSPPKLGNPNAKPLSRAELDQAQRERSSPATTRPSPTTITATR